MNNYNIFTTNIKQELSEVLSKYDENKIFVFADENTHRDCYGLISDVFKQAPYVVEIPLGEANKNIKTAEFLWNYLSENKADRYSLIVNLGGGIVTDIGGFVASTYQRGIDYVNIPTTLLAQVDASIGGKNGVNLNELKNQIGTFNHPVRNLVCSEFLKTLPQREITAGFAEVIKHALLESETEWQKLKSINPAHIDFRYLQHIIEDSAKIKLKFVNSDPNEKGLRKALNLGHTVGHAIETFYHRKNIDILHGEALAIGLICELFLSNQLFTFNFEKLFEVSEYIVRILQVYDIFYDDYEEIYSIMKHDKKNKNEEIRFSLLNGIGDVKIDKVCSKQDIFEALNFYCQIR